MAEEAKEDEGKKAKKGGGFKRILFILLFVIILGGGGAAGGYFAAGALGGGEHAEPEDPNAPKVIMKDGTAVSAKEAGLSHAPQGAKTAQFKVTYHTIEDPFTSNLKGGSGFAQVSLAVSTYYDEKIIEALTEHDIAIRSAVLMAISERTVSALETTEGKNELKGALKTTINDVLEAKTGFRGVDDVYFTGFVVQ